MIMLKITKKQGLVLSLEDTFFKKSHGGDIILIIPSCFRAKRVTLK